MYGFCIVGLSRDIYYILGGFGKKGLSTAVYKWKKGIKWERLAPLSASKIYFGCALIHNQSEIIVAGGATGSRWKQSRTVEIYNIASNTWRKGKSLPFIQGSFFGYNNTIWMLGALENMTYSYDYRNDEWCQMSKIKMKGFPARSSIVMVEDNSFKCS